MSLFLITMKHNFQRAINYKADVHTSSSSN